jgi:hypothetical protein
MPKTKATFIEPMLLLRAEKLPQGADWLCEIKLDGYRALAVKSGGKVQLRSRNDYDFTERYSSIAAALRTVPDETVLDVSRELHGPLRRFCRLHVKVTVNCSFHANSGWVSYLFGAPRLGSWPYTHILSLQIPS